MNPKILGFNDWKHLSTILKPAIESYEKDKLFLENIKEMIKPLVFVISSSDLIRKSIQLFLGESDIVGDYYNCQTFETIKEYLCYIKNNNKKPKFIICDESIELKNIYRPIIYLTNKTKEDVFYKTMSKLFFAKKFIEAIKEIYK